MQKALPPPLSRKGRATVLGVKLEVPVGLFRGRDGRVKAGAVAPPPSAAAALTRPPRRDVGAGSVRRSGMLGLLPMFAVAHDGVEDGQQLARGGDEGDQLGLAGGDERVAR